MKCKQAQPLFDEYLDTELVSPNNHVLDLHLAECERCQLSLKQRMEMVAAYRQLPAVEAPTAQLMHKVRELRRVSEVAHISQRNKWIRVGAISSMAASLVIGIAILWVMNVLSNQSNLEESLSQTEIAFPKYRHQTISVMFNSKRALGNVKFSVIPPESVYVEGFIGERVVVWNGQLRKGENLLNIPLIVNRVSSSELLLRIEHKLEKRQFSVTVDAAKSQSSAI